MTLLSIRGKSSGAYAILWLLFGLASCGADSPEENGPGDGSEEGPIAPTKVAPSNPSLVGRLGDLPMQVVLDEVLFTASEGADYEAARALAEALEGEVVGHVPEIALWQIRIGNPDGSSARLQQALAACQANNAAEFCFPNEVFQTLAIAPSVYPDDGYSWKGENDDCSCSEAWSQFDIRNQIWGQQAIHLPEAWAISTGSADQAIAVVDVGGSLEHRDFSGRGLLKYGSSWDNAHGTHVTGILGATGNNKTDVAGVNWKAPLWLYEVGGLWNGPPSSLVAVNGVTLTAAQEALIQAAMDGAKLINLSYGRLLPKGECTRPNWAEAHESMLESDRRVWRAVMKSLKNRGVLVVAAAGNSSDVFVDGCEADAKWTSGPVLFADDPDFAGNVIVVAAVGNPTDAYHAYFGTWADQWHALWRLSSTGDLVDVAAPGAAILSLCQMGTLTCLTEHTYYASGTSMAAPFVTGIASLVWARRPEFTPAQVKEKIVAGARRAGPQVYRRVTANQAEPVVTYPFHVVNAYETLRILDRVTGCSDADGDGYGLVEADGGVGLDCGHPEADCDDADAGTYPGATEICDGLDNNCNGHVDEENVCQGQLSGAPVSGVIPGEFNTNGGDFELSVSPLDKNGDLIFQNISKENFSFHNIEVWALGSSTKVASGTAWPESIELFAPMEGAQQLSVVLLMDSSGSMGESDPTFERVRAAQSFLALLGQEDRVAVMDFGTGPDSEHSCVRLLSQFSADKASAQAALEHITAMDNTPLFCAVTEAVQYLSTEATDRRVILLLTDGQSTEDDPSASESMAASVASELGIPVFAVGLGYDLDFSLLQGVAKDTAGSFALASDAQVLAGVFNAVGVANTKGRIVVHGKGQFQPPVQQAGQYRISGVLKTFFGGNTTQTKFEFSVYLM